MSKDKDNIISITSKNNEEKYPYISISGPSCYKKHKARVLLIRNQGSALFANGDIPNAIITFNFWREHGLIMVDADMSRRFMLDMINHEQLLVLNYT